MDGNPHVMEIRKMLQFLSSPPGYTGHFPVSVYANQRVFCTKSSLRQQTYPESLFEEIKPFIRPPDRLEDSHDFIKRAWADVDALDQMERASLKLITSVYNTDRTYKDIAKYIYNKRRPDFLTFYAAGIDVAGHKYWAHMEPELFSFASYGPNAKAVCGLSKPNRTGQ